MSDMAPEATGQPLLDAGTDNATPWAQYLADLPESVRPLVEPKFKEWDANTTQRFQKVHSDYEPLKPYQAIVDNGWDYADVQQALTLAATLNENPQAVFDALVQNYGFGAPEQGQEQENPDDFSQQQQQVEDPRFAQLEQMTNQLAQIEVERQQAVQTAREDQQLEQLMTSLKTEHGDFNERYVMTQIYGGMDPVAAVQDFQNMIAQASQNRPQVPTIMGSGGGLPSQSVNPSQLSDRDRKNLVAQMIAQSQQQP